MTKRLTFMFVPDSTGIARQVSLPAWLVWGALAFVFIIVFTTVFLTAEFFSGQVNEAELARLQQENQDLARKYEQMRWDLAEANSRYQELVQKEIAIRTMFDLPEINLEERQLGVGGPSLPIPENVSTTEKVAYATGAEVDRLLTLSRYELDKFTEVEQKLNNLQDRLRHTPSIKPTTGWLSRGFGKKYDPFTGYRQMHRGIDIANHTGTPIVATADGVVKSARRRGQLGKTVVIDHGYGFVTRYGHLSKYNVKVGQHVKRGDVIAFMGSTG
ncbi:MAG: M23 family metallopeptidase, partial [Candidatus Zixiibacteriota bacterium]